VVQLRDLLRTLAGERRDHLLEQRDRVALPARGDALGLRAETDPASRGNTFVECESFVLELRLKQAAYVMVLDVDPQGFLTVLYPVKTAEHRIVPAGAPQAIPADPKAPIVATPPFGTDQMAVLAFAQPPAFFADLDSAGRFEVDGSRAAALAAGLAHLSGAVSVQQIAVRTYAGNGKASCGS
jgi:hypothetical protein